MHEPISSVLPELSLCAFRFYFTVMFCNWITVGHMGLMAIASMMQHNHKELFLKSTRKLLLFLTKTQDIETQKDFGKTNVRAMAAT